MDLKAYDSLFQQALQRVQPGSLAHLFAVDTEAQIASLLAISKVQDAFQFQARYLGFRCAQLLIDDQGNLKQDALHACIRAIEAGFYSLGPHLEDDCLIYDHLLHCLHSMQGVWPLVQKFSIPLCHKKAYDFVRETLWPEAVGSVQTPHVRKAVLTAWLTPLRQATGSCFATAPAILLQKTPEYLFADLCELLSTGQLKRIVHGQQYAVPMCLSMGTGDLERRVSNSNRLGWSPGLIVACEAMQVFSSQDPLAEKAARLQTLIDSLEHIQTPRQILREIALKITDLTEQEIADEEYFAKMELEPMLARGGAVFYREPSLRAQKVSDFKKRLDLAETAFLALNQCALLRVWEYTIASLCDIKTEFAKWNLYVGLGMQEEQPMGIAEFLYRAIDQKLQECNGQIQELAKRYEEVSYKARALEMLLQRSVSDPKYYETYGEWTTASREAQMIVQEQERLQQLAKSIAAFFSALLNHYDAKFQEYFQEVFDPSVAEKEEHLFEDSPAGFRLLYKHGRVDAAAWTLIFDEEAYIRALRDFFSSAERQIEVPDELGRNFVSEVTTALIQFIQTEDFINSARLRAESHGRKTPWDYVSGGTLQTLVATYHSRSAPLTEKTLLPKSEMELLQTFLSLEKRKNLLMHSPTHAFLLRLDLLGDDVLQQVEENRRFANQWTIQEEWQEEIGHSISEKLPELQRPLFLHKFRKAPQAKTPGDLRRFLTEAMEELSLSQDIETFVDAHLYEKTRLFSADSAKQILHAILQEFPELSPTKVAKAISELYGSSVGSYQLYQMAKAIVFSIVQTPFSSLDWDQKIAEQLRRFQAIYPHLIVCADTNWSGWFFGFVSNLYTGRLELWRLNRTGTQGMPMHRWRRWFSRDNQIPWTILVRPEEYGA